MGYLVPQFPGQTHAFFWREIIELEKRGARVRLFSTRKPPAGVISHSWSKSAMERTAYLGTAGLKAGLSALARLPLREVLASARSEPRAYLADLMLTIPAAADLLRYCREDGISHVHVHSCGRAALIAALARAMGGPTYSLTLHGDLQAYGPGQRFKWQGASFATIITKTLIAEMRETIPDVLPERILLQPMGVDVDLLSRDTPYQPYMPGQTLRLFCCARLNVIKGHLDLLKAVKLLKDAGQDILLELAGEDDQGGDGYRRVVEQEIAALGLGDQVRMLGALDSEAIHERILAAHLFVMPSLYEALGVSYMEAMSCGLPSIGTDVGGVAELITSGKDGILVPPRDPAALAGTIKQVAEDSELCLRLSAAGRARIVADFSSARGAETLLEGIAATIRKMAV